MQAHAYTHNRNYNNIISGLRNSIFQKAGNLSYSSLLSRSQGRISQREQGFFIDCREVHPNSPGLCSISSPNLPLSDKIGKYSLVEQPAAGTNTRPQSRWCYQHVHQEYVHFAQQEQHHSIKLMKYGKL